MVRKQYAPVKKFEIQQDMLSSGVVRGLAIPASGSLPCALALAAGPNVLAVAAATNFSSVARERNIRLGWCGFEVGGLNQAIATGHDVEIRCHTTGQVQVRWDGTTLASCLERQSRKHLTVQGMLSRLSSNITLADLDQVVPFALDLACRSGSRPFLRASYQYILRRWPEPEAESRFAGDYTTPQAIRELWNVLVNSPEATAARTPFLAGPFDPSFPFPLDPLEQQ